jgi:hypothetical protein
MVNVKSLVPIKTLVYNLARNNLFGTLNKVKRYVKKNWGSPFIAGFLFLLIGAAVSTSAGLSSLANTLAVYTFYALIGGVILQLICYLKYSPHDGSESV